MLEKLRLFSVVLEEGSLRCAADRPELLAGQKAIVTGGSSGIGKAIALALGEAGTLATYLKAAQEPMQQRSIVF